MVLKGGGTCTVTIGEAPGATRGFDRKVDSPAPPPMPVGFYAAVPLVDSVFGYIPWLWKDMRPVSDSSVTWTVVIYRSEGPGTVEYKKSDLPPGRVIWNHKYDLALDTPAVLTHKMGDTIPVTYYPPAAVKKLEASAIAIPQTKSVKSGTSEKGLQYKVEGSGSQEVKIEVLNPLDQPLTTAAIGSKPSGTYFWVWDGKDSAGKTHETGRYRFHITVGKKEAWGSFYR